MGHNGHEPLAHGAHQGLCGSRAPPVQRVHRAFPSTTAIPFGQSSAHRWLVCRQALEKKSQILVRVFQVPPNRVRQEIHSSSRGRSPRDRGRLPGQTHQAASAEPLRRVTALLPQQPIPPGQDGKRKSCTAPQQADTDSLVLQGSKYLDYSEFLSRKFF